MSATLILLVTFTLAGAAVDVRSRRIPNVFTATLAFAAFAVHAGDGAGALFLTAAVMIVSFALGALAFSVGWLGGGDVKLIAAACGVAGYPGCIWLVLFILISGAVLGIVQAAGQRRLLAFIRNATALAMTGAAPQTPTLLPYGVAIAGGSTAYALATLLAVIRVP